MKRLSKLWKFYKKHWTLFMAIFLSVLIVYSIILLISALDKKLEEADTLISAGYGYENRVNLHSYTEEELDIITRNAAGWLSYGDYFVIDEVWLSDDNLYCGIGHHPVTNVMYFISYSINDAASCCQLNDAEGKPLIYEE